VGLLYRLILSLMVGGALLPRAALADSVVFPLLVPVTGFLALEGTSQRNGALLAIGMAPPALGVRGEVIDTGTTPEGAITALERASGLAKVRAVVASMLGTQMLAMLPLADEAHLPLITVSGTAGITERGSPYVFRFFPSDAVAKLAHARYVVEERHARRPALITQATAYGQSGRALLADNLTRLGAPPVFDEAVEVGVRDLTPVLNRALAAEPDLLVLHLHAGPSALLVRQAAAQGVSLPIVGGSALHQPSTVALLEPRELKGVCAETAVSPVSASSAAVAQFVAEYRARFETEPDAFALCQFDGVRMVLNAIASGASTPEAVREALATQSYQGLAMTYKSDGKGNMAHSAEIICYDGESRQPRTVKRYQDLEP